MTTALRRYVVTFLALVLICAGPLLARSPAQSSNQLFTFRVGFWVNLHHFLYVLGRARNNAPDSRRSAVVKAPSEVEGFSARAEADRLTWDGAVSFYAGGPSTRDAIFDDDLVRITKLLADLADDGDPAKTSIDPALAAALNHAAPIYRDVWWARHQQASLARRDELQALVNKQGAALVNRLSAVYVLPWPSTPRVVDLCAYANWAGAYSSDRHGSLIVVSSLDDSLRGVYGLEMLLHESAHQWDNEVERRLRDAAEKQNTRVAGLLSHALIWSTTGELVREVFPNHTPYAVQFGIWDLGGYRGMKPLLDRYWLPYVHGSGTFEEAAAKLVNPQ